ncbi:TPA: alcohol dehydrogenase catalytic domain-containing protein [Candidatus Bathyarchaeota archaeon]|nr:alcohol dehydrogenase catalytic domain-containing protein [Candidatus Bathyarchaeota archaeon]
MRAVIKSKPAPGVEFAEVPKPKIKPDEVLIEVKTAAICGSDLGIYDYTPAYSKMRLPVVMGHEFSGRVAKVGKEVKGYKVGDRILAESVKACGVCAYCRTGHENLCDASTLFGIHVDGGMAEHIAVPYKLLHRLPEELGYDAGALIEPLSNALHFVKDCTPIQLGDFVVVQGCGPIGLFSAQLFRLAGAEVIVTGVNVDTERFKIAGGLGLETVNVETEDLSAIVMERTGGRGADTAFVATGAPPAVAQAAGIVKKRGRITVIGIFGRPVEVPMTQVVRREITLAGAYDAKPENFDQSIKLAKSGAIKVGELITHRLSLEKAGEAFEAAKSRVGCKVVFVP